MVGLMLSGMRHELNFSSLFFLHPLALSAGYVSLGHT